MDEPTINHALQTRRIGNQRRLTTQLIEKPLPPLRASQVRIQVGFVPLHGSFWLASDPQGRHPRFDEFLADGAFVFGNGGVGRVIDTGPDCQRVRVGDHVSVMGHLPCSHTDCIGCRELHRYTECDYGEGTILGHGKGAPDGTYAEYCTLDEIACEPCFPAGSTPTDEQLLPFMFAFLVADVRNALTRDPRTLRSRNAIIMGAGLSGHIAAWLLLHANPDIRLLVADTQAQALDSIQRLGRGSIATLDLSASRNDTQQAIGQLSAAKQAAFSGGLCDLVFDASSGNATPEWANPRILNPRCHCIPFGFGSEHLLLDKACMQMSGLKVLLSRGVGDLENRALAVQLVREGAADLPLRDLLDQGTRLDGLEQALAFVRAQQASPDAYRHAPRAFIAP